MVIFTSDSIHGELYFSPLAMPLPRNTNGHRLSGDDMCAYAEKFADTFLPGTIRFEIEILDIRRANGSGWDVEIHDLRTGAKEILTYARVILCTGVRSISIRTNVL